MMPDNLNNQLGLFGVVEEKKKDAEPGKQKDAARKESIAVTEAVVAEPVKSDPSRSVTTDLEPPRGRTPSVEKPAAASRSSARTQPVASRKRGKLPLKAKPVSGLVPEGDVRLTANIREDLHLKLKIAAAHRRTTIGELIEDLVDRYL